MDGALFANLDPGQFSKAALPHLQKLALVSTIDPYQMNPALTADILELPEMIAPNLRSLRLKDYIIPFNPATLNKLKLEFSWDFCAGDTPASPYPKRTFLGMLPRFHNLRSLKLERCIPLLSSDDSECQTVTMGALEHLHLHDKTRRCLGLLSHLSTPASTRYELNFNDVDAEFPDLSALFHAILPHLNHMDTSRVSGLTVREGNITKLAPCLPKPTAQIVRGSPGPFQRDLREQLLLQFYPVESHEPRIDIMLSFLQKIVDFSGIRSLQIEINPSIAYDRSAWTAFLARFPHLSTLHLLNLRRTSALLALTAPDSDEPAQPGSDSVVAPNLRSLWISSIDLRGPRNEAEVQSRGPNRLQFLRMLSSRKKAGVPLDYLHIEILIALGPEEVQKSLKPRLETLVTRVEIEYTATRDPETDIDEDEDEDEDEEWE